MLAGILSHGSHVMSAYDHVSRMHGHQKQSRTSVEDTSPLRITKDYNTYAFVASLVLMRTYNGAPCGRYELQFGKGITVAAYN